MKRYYYAQCGDVKNRDPVRSGNAKGVWTQLEKATGKDRKWLMDFGWRVKQGFELEKSEIAAFGGYEEIHAPIPQQAHTRNDRFPVWVIFFVIAFVVAAVAAFRFLTLP